MELDICPQSPNKIDQMLALKSIREPGATATFQDVLLEFKERYTSTIHVFDVGANVGYFALLEANVLDDRGAIYAIEPDPMNAARLRRNVQLNEYANVNVLQLAAGAENAHRNLSKTATAHHHRMTEVLEDRDAVDTVEVEVYPLDYLIDKRDIPHEEVIIIRIDVEGYENYVIDGMSGVLSSDQPVYVFIELHPSMESVSIDAIINKLETSAFRPEYVSYDGGNSYEPLDSFDVVRKVDSNTHLMASRLTRDG